MNTKPCELPCEKCGSNDVNRKFRAINEEIKPNNYGGIPNRFCRNLSGTWHAKVTREHITHHCQCCHYEWATLPLPKSKRKAA